MQDFKKEEYWKNVEEFITELKTAKYWLKNDGDPKKEWRLFETRGAARAAAGDAAKDAAWAAAWDATWDATRDAARGAAWAAAGDAARGAAWDAARGAARGAAWAAAWGAAGDAARDAAWGAAWGAALFSRMLVCVGLEININHLIHVNARMEVWRKGYGLLCDIDGVLYVYKKVN